MEATSEHVAEKPVASVRANYATGLALAWMIAAVGGAIAITAFSAQTGIRLAVPIAIMFLYGYYGYYSPGRNTAKLADSIYFLGFLWTLYALINEFVFRNGSATNS